MSGGAYGYLSNDLEDMARRTGASLNLLATIEHELDWGVSCDTCLECAERRIIAALKTFFRDRCEDSMRAEAVARDAKQNLCLKHGLPVRTA